MLPLDKEGSVRVKPSLLSVLLHTAVATWLLLDLGR